MKIVYKLTLGFLIISILLGFVVYNGYKGAISIKDQYDQVAVQTLPILDDLNNIKLSLRKIVDDTLELMTLTARGQNQVEFKKSRNSRRKTTI